MILRSTDFEAHVDLCQSEISRHLRNMAGEFFGTVAVVRWTGLGWVAVVLFNDPKHCTAFISERL